MNKSIHQNGVLSVKNLVKHYGKVTAVDGVSFSIDSGVCFGLLGPNGAGKTTTIEVVEGLLTQDSGEILYKGKRKGKRFHEEVGIQFQNTELPFYLTVKETLILFRNMYKTKADLDELISICRLQDILDRDNRKISGGQKQRLLLAIALANDPELIFLDEPTTGLDPQARHHLWEIIFQLKKNNKTIVLTTHYMEEAQLLCDTIAIMDHGRFIAEGTPDSLLKAHCSGVSILLPTVVSSEVMAGFPWRMYTLGDGRTEIQTDDVTGCLNELTRRGVDLSGITIRPRNLEDLFLQLTGNELRN